MDFKRSEETIFLVNPESEVPIATVHERNITWGDAFQSMSLEDSKWIRYCAFYWILVNTDLL